MYEYHPSGTPQREASAPSGPRAPRRKRRWLRTVALVLVCAIVGAGAGFGGARLALQTDSLPALQAASISAPLPADTAQSSLSGHAAADDRATLSPSRIYEQYVGSTVGINTEITTNVFGQVTTAPAAGSGFILTQDGYILTNHHVIAGAASISIVTVDGTTYPAVLVGSDEANDIAVIKIDANGLTPVTLGSSEALKVGQSVCAIGNPLGELTFTLTDGIVSALERPITTEDGIVQNMIQTNCAVNSGNSGGPLFNDAGQVIGIVSAKYASSGVEGLGFAIPIDDVRDLITDLMQHGYVTGRAYLGISISDVSAADAQRYQLTPGAYVELVAPGSCAEKAGLRQGDIVTAFNGVTVDCADALIAAKNDCHAGDTAELTVSRGGKTLTLTVVLDEENEQTVAALTRALAEYEAQQAPAASLPEPGDNGYGYDPFYDFFFSWP